MRLMISSVSRFWNSIVPSSCTSSTTHRCAVGRSPGFEISAIHSCPRPPEFHRVRGLPAPSRGPPLPAFSRLPPLGIVYLLCVVCYHLMTHLAAGDLPIAAARCVQLLKVKLAAIECGSLAHMCKYRGMERGEGCDCVRCQMQAVWTGVGIPFNNTCVEHIDDILH